MKFDVSLLIHDLGQMPALARFAEELKFDGIWTFETSHEPYLPLVLAAEHSERLSIGTSIAVAFPRSPTITAQIAWDLAHYSKGRFILGLGTQVKGHIERRFAVQWDSPIDKMRDYILAVRAVWDSWQNQTRLNYRGKFYQLTLMTPFFSPAPHSHHPVPIFIAGVNRRMCRLAGELCEGLHVHPLHTARYLREVILPEVGAGLTAAQRTRTALELSSSVFVIPADDPQEAQKYEADVRRQISFYASTPPYRPVFDLEGWGTVADQLKALAARGKWDEMPRLITNEILERFALRGTWAELPALMLKKYDGLLDRVSYYFPLVPGENENGWRASAAAFKIFKNIP